MLKVTNDEVWTDISISSVCERSPVNHQFSHNHAKAMILKFDVCTFALRLVKLFRNSLPSQFLLNSLGSALHPEPYGFSGKNTELPAFFDAEAIGFRVKSQIKTVK
ncbi:hypothetical protein TSAR_011189 [Trichomalopsis sarcophagae]|uniref:Uncharacterized protein n=1 Tax=Trichomalopsis sarcophagae TaxID=543379 RepID=A0A232EKF3_9HYME|nr:hypothetical protein TSAR_011189 [Trichomalopsis sarcophagae]